MTQLRKLLEDGASRAKVYDVVDRAWGGARRRRRLHRTLAAGATAVTIASTVTAVTYGLPGRAPRPDPPLVQPSTPVITSVPTSPAGPPLPRECAVHFLALPTGYPRADVTAMDPTGRFIVGTAYSAGGQRRLVRWDDGVVQTVSIPGSDPQLVAVNSSGIAVGYSFAGDGATRAYVLDAQTRTQLQGDSPEVFGINAAGTIVGLLRRDGAFSVPVVWRTPAAPPEVLPLPPGMSYGRVDGIDDDGTMIGVGFTGSGALQGVAWHADGSLWDLAAQFPARDTTFPQVLMTAPRSGWLGLSQSEFSDGGQTRGEAYLWNIRTNEVRRPNESGGFALNGNGWEVTPQGLTDRHATVPLPDPAPASTRNSVSVLDLSDDGHVILGSMSQLQGDYPIDTVPFVWRCS